MIRTWLALLGMLFAFAANAETVKFAPAPDIQERVQEALILAEPGAVIEFEEGTYEFTQQLSLDVDGVTLRGKGMYRTIFSFKGQEAGSEGLYVTSDNVVLEDFAIEDTKGNAMKSNGANNIVLRRLRTEWTGGPKETNGAYGLYPVSSENVLIEGCVAIGASDAGIYVGQTKNVIVRRSRAEFNVAGIEIENCHGADVYQNIATNNTGGILVFDLPGLPMQRGRDVRVFNNIVYNNDTENFAPEGNIVAKVARGTGVMVMSNSNVEIFDNDIRDHRTYNVIICSYLAAGVPITDPNYYPYPERIHIHHNNFGPGGHDPSGEVGALVGLLTGRPVPDIVWDGIMNPEAVVDGKLPAELGLSIHSNTKEGGELTFANINAADAMKDPAKVQVTRDLAPHAAPLPGVEPIVIAGVK